MNLIVKTKDAIGKIRIEPFTIDLSQYSNLSGEEIYNAVCNAWPNQSRKVIDIVSVSVR